MQNALNSACHIVREQYKPYIHISACLDIYVYKAIYNYRGFPGSSDGKQSDAVQETWVRSLSQQDPLEKGMATHSGILIWRIPWTQEPGWLQSTGLQRVRCD